MEKAKTKCDKCNVTQTVTLNIKESDGQGKAQVQVQGICGDHILDSLKDFQKRIPDSLEELLDQAYRERKAELEAGQVG